MIIHGPNLNLLGKREPEIYGSKSLSEINSELISYANGLKLELHCQQSNAEHDIVTLIQEASDDGVNFIIINPAAFTHTSIAIRDAFLAVAIPFIEVHLSNVQAREEFRKISYLCDIAVGCITGFGQLSYRLALDAADDYLKSNKGNS